MPPAESREIVLTYAVSDPDGDALRLNLTGPGAMRWDMQARTIRFADGPDEVHRNQIAKLELAQYMMPR